VGAVIGPGGSNIRALATRTGTELSVRDDNTSFPYVIYGATVQMIDEVRVALNKYRAA